MDSFDDEISFKPLTEGLGFHRRVESPAGAGASSAPSVPKNSQAIDAASLGGIKTRPMNSNKTSLSAPALALEVESRSGVSASRSDSRAEIRVEGRSADSLSALMASLPPSMDFSPNQASDFSSGSHSTRDDRTAINDRARDSALAKEAAVELGRPKIYQPIAREDYKIGGSVGGQIGNSAIGGASNSMSPNAMVGTSAPLKAPKPGTVAAAGSIAGALSPTLPTLPSFKNTTYQAKLDESFARAFPNAEKLKKKTSSEVTATETALDRSLQPASQNLAGAFLDALVVLGLSTLFLVAILTITKADLVGLLTNSKTDFATQVQLGILYLSVMQLYLLSGRALFGATLGEWAFEMQLGTVEEQARTVYPILVLWRNILITITGLIVLPLISAIFRRDLVGRLTGVQLYRRTQPQALNSQARAH